MKAKLVYGLVFVNSVLLTAFLISLHWCFFVALVLLLSFSTYATSKDAMEDPNLVKELAKDVYCLYELGGAVSKERLVRLFASLNALSIVMFLNTFHCCFLFAASIVVVFSVHYRRKIDEEIRKKIGEFFGRFDIIVDFTKNMYCKKNSAG
jgi:hypothetical protein